ncbi:cytochrome c oxidase [Spiromyces aspiralis]|uniref:Cytochrome c oxidase n=1 Tax=Spiromyces aspiralis TaxID=68401 RepID=A0ACC1HPT1_9FUNG|nr:cytochrome c oxidase [Spiromyces aspiralis]
MFRQVAARAVKLSGRRLQSTTTSATPVMANTTEWTKLGEAEQKKISTQLAEIMKGDWNTVSAENKKAAYYITYGPHGARTPHSKPGDTQKVVLGSIGLICVSLFFTTLIRRSVEQPKTMTKEWQEASNEYAKELNLNPISGISSKDYSGKGFVQ